MNIEEMTKCCAFALRVLEHAVTETAPGIMLVNVNDMRLFAREELGQEIEWAEISEVALQLPILLSSVTHGCACWELAHMAHHLAFHGEETRH